MRNAIFLFIVLQASVAGVAQVAEVGEMKDRLEMLTSPRMKGRGYIGSAADSAAALIASWFNNHRIANNFQNYAIPINTFPTATKVVINGRTLTAGKDYVVHAGADNFTLSDSNIAVIDCADIKTKKAWRRLRRAIDARSTYYMRNFDTVYKYLDIGIRKFPYEMGKGTFIIEMPKKLTWLACSKLTKANVLFVHGDALREKIRSVDIQITNRFIPKFQLKNIIGIVPGTARPDSLVVFTAHYDHLGEMGPGVVFPGANDNASGVSMIMQLASYYARHPARYSMAFILFSGEEAGLFGSKYFVRHPEFPLRKIRFLLNLDMVGDAGNGATIVNAIAHKYEFELLQMANSSEKLLPEIFSRGQSKNSDHYPFARKKVPAFFIYGNGTHPFYHDIDDRPETIGFKNGEQLLQLLRSFVRSVTAGSRQAISSTDNN
jgi:hypothetical protein